uniref:Uncharacterized protein n=1 Tax=Trichogramma kaykai TaxID=54128 RepID=A0ABD2WB44_9HYME
MRRSRALQQHDDDTSSQKKTKQKIKHVANCANGLSGFANCFISIARDFTCEAIARQAKVSEKRSSSLTVDI